MHGVHGAQVTKLELQDEQMTDAGAASCCNMSESHEWPGDALCCQHYHNRWLQVVCMQLQQRNDHKL